MEAAGRGLCKLAAAFAWKQQRANFDAWLQGALLRGAKAAHRFCNHWGALPRLENTRSVDGHIVTHPDDVMHIRVQEWSKRWEKKGPQHLELIRRCIEKMRKLAQDVVSLDGHVDVNTTSVARAIAVFRTDTAQSAHGWSPADFRDLPLEALEALCALIRSIIDDVCLPASELMVVIAFLGNAAGGERPIGLLGALTGS